ncbi:3-hydroxyisobutyryl-CoA hydrolase, mitochondrial isoform X2 [Centruroides vittatus]|uniref:3-hydroxyisobutyryl-CoA hydrolase, mitochondrial isoform X2 n=1 Tax=Centruroides vittatus TaxID=120091 RepID=UPI003510BD78
MTFTLLLRSVQSNTKRTCACIVKRTMSSNEGEVILEKMDNKGIITLNRPKVLNSLNISMIRTIYPKLKEWNSDPEIKMVIIKGAGDKAFCAGGDVKAVAEAGKKGESLSSEFFKEEYQLNNLIATLQIPYVALIHGITMGGGVGLSVHGAFRVATEKTVFAMPETAIGFFPDVGGSYFLPRLPGKLGLYLALTGFRLSGRDVLKSAIATHFVSSERLKDLESDLLRIPNPTLQTVDKVLLKFDFQCENEHKKEFALKHDKGKINNVFAGDSIEAIFQNLEKDGTEWSKKQLETLSKMSPTSLKVTFHQLKRGGKMTLQEALNMEYRLSQRFIKDHDFFEGVRAVLIDKDNSPKWKPSTINEVSDEIIKKYFEKLPSSQELQL